MPRYIDADALETHEMIIPHGNGMYEDVEVVYMDDIRDMPTADVRENRVGKWIYQGKNKKAEWKCFECGDCFDIAGYNFCPNCGADMRGETK